MAAPLFVSSGDLVADRRYQWALDYLKRGDPEAAADILEQVVELTSVLREARAGIEQRTEDLLHGRDVLADAQSPAQRLAQVRRRREVVGVYMRFENPLHLGAQLPDPCDEPISAGRTGAPRLGVVVQHAVDQRALHRAAIQHQITHGPRRWIEEAFDLKS